MKELSIEEKAKAYDEAIKVAENIHRFSSDLAEIKRMEEIFPELAESEGERIRKGLVAIITDFESLYLQENYSLSREDILAWLEKQADHAKFINSIQVGDKVTRNENGVVVNFSQLKRIAKPAEKQGEKRSYASETMNEKGDFDSGFTRMMEKEQKPWSEEDDQYLLVCKNALAKYQVSDKWDATIISRWLEDKVKSSVHKYIK